MIELLVLTALFLVAVYLHDAQRERAHGLERQEWHKERQLLLNRIKPETAQAVIGDDAPILHAVTPESDKDYWDAVEERTA